MKITKISIVYSIFLLLCVFSLNLFAQTNPQKEILIGENLKRIVPSDFYFAGQSAPTQLRNSSAVRFGKDRYVIVGLVDTSGYSTEISGKYEGFLITDSPILVGGKELNTGAYGFGFSKDGKINIFDLGSKQIFSAETTNDAKLKRPRPLMMVDDSNGIKLYKERSYVIISAK